MFEKEAEELFKKKPLGYEMKPELEIYTDGFKDGYNKAKEEMQKNGLALQSDMDKTIEQNIALKKELNKANEWHKPSEKLPESVAKVRLANWQKYEEENKELKELVEKYRQAVDKCLHITFMGGGCEVHTIGQYSTLVDGYLTDVEGLAKWKN